jgi:hypothetical protein
MSDFKRGAFNYLAYYLRSGQYLPGSRRTETILTYHRAQRKAESSVGLSSPARFIPLWQNKLLVLDTKLLAKVGDAEFGSLLLDKKNH